MSCCRSITFAFLIRSNWYLMHFTRFYYRWAIFSWVHCMYACMYHLYRFVVLLGFNEGQCHGFSRCCRLLSRVKCYSFYSKCWKRTSLDSFAGADNATEYNGHSSSSWNIKRTANHFGNNAGSFCCTHIINIYIESWKKTQKQAFQFYKHELIHVKRVSNEL